MKLQVYNAGINLSDREEDSNNVHNGGNVTPCIINPDLLFVQYRAVQYVRISVV